jgi:tetratricopeptide (TPR) repeat protein
MHIRAVVIIILFCAAIFVLFPFAMLANKSTAYFAYKEITYKTMADRIACGSKAPEETALRIGEYFHRYLFTPYGAKAVDKDTYNDLIRGIAYCDQKAWGMSAFLAKKGIDNRMIMTVNPNGQSNHTALEADIGGKWRYLDPQYALVMRKKGGEPVSYLEVCENPSLLVDSPRMRLMRKVCPGEFEAVSRYLARNAYNRGSRPVIWNSPGRSKGNIKRAISRVLDAYVTLFGRRFSYLYQDAYMGIYSAEGGHNTDYLLARNYDIFGRYDRSVYYYRRFLESSPSDENRYPAMMYLSIIYTNNGDHKAAIEILRIMMADPESSEWAPYGYYWLGYNYEAQNDVGKSADCYRASIMESAKSEEPSAKIKLLELDSFEGLAKYN